MEVKLQIIRLRKQLRKLNCWCRWSLLHYFSFHSCNRVITYLCIYLCRNKNQYGLRYHIVLKNVSSLHGSKKLIFESKLPLSTGFEIKRASSLLKNLPTVLLVNAFELDYLIFFCYTCQKAVWLWKPQKHSAAVRWSLSGGAYKRCLSGLSCFATLNKTCLTLLLDHKSTEDEQRKRCASRRLWAGLWSFSKSFDWLEWSDLN